MMTYLKRFQVSSVLVAAFGCAKSSAPLRSLEDIEYGSGVDMRSFYWDDTKKSILILHSMGCPTVFMQWRLILPPTEKWKTL